MSPKRSNCAAIRASPGSGGSGSVQAMQAADINLRYGPDGRALESAILMRQASIQLARPDGSAGQTLAAEFIDTGLAPDGAVTRLLGRDNVQVTIPAAADAAARVVKAPLVNAVGEAGRGLTGMTFENGVEYREEASKGSSGRSARAKTLKAVLAADGGIDQADFSDGFRFEDGKLVATSTDGGVSHCQKRIGAPQSGGSHGTPCRGRPCEPECPHHRCDAVATAAERIRQGLGAIQRRPPRGRARDDTPERQGAGRWSTPRRSRSTRPAATGRTPAAPSCGRNRARPSSAPIPSR